MKRLRTLTQRMVLALVLVPLVPTISIMGISAAKAWMPNYVGDELRWFQGLFSVLWVCGTIAIWRTAVLWTLGRAGRTALVSLIPFVQVVYNLPLWTSSCLEDALRVGQHQVSIGLWVWAATWVWWSWERVSWNSMNPKAQPFIRIPQSTGRLAASIGVMPFAFGVFLILGTFVDEVLGLMDPASLCAAYAGASLVSSAAWILIWRKAVAWYRGLLRRTLLGWLLLAGLPIALMLLAEQGWGDVLDMMFYSLPIVGWSIWMGWTVHYWPQTSGLSRAVGTAPRCPACGYSLNGLRATKCPECGTEPTLEQLWESANDA